MLKRLLIALLFTLITTASAEAARLVVDIPELKQGSTSVFILKNVNTNDGVSAHFSGGDAFVRSGENGVWGVLGVDLRKRPGPYRLKVMAGGELYSAKVSVKDGKFKVERLTLDKKKVELSSKALKRVKAEARDLGKELGSSTDFQLWNGEFLTPAKGRLSSNFGLRRILNGRPKSPHSGIDIAAKEGVRVVASNSGRVAFAGDFFFKGNFIVIDHGLGLFTSYSHLSKIGVKAGDRVKKGAPIGKVGSTGRVTGAHLHFAATIGSARVSPDELFRAAKELAAMMSEASLLAFQR